MSLFRSAYCDGDRLEIDGSPVRLKVHARARRVSLRVDRTKREVIATAPSARRLAEAAAFARDRADWIAARLGEIPPAEELAPGMTVELFGEPHLLTRDQGRAKFVAADAWGPARIVVGEAAFGPAVVRLIKRHALERLTAMTRIHAEALGAPTPKVLLGDPKGRWGSCKPPVGREPAVIRYSWRLALAPLAVADYVAAHECGHLLELNHGPQFWAHVHGLVGSERPHRDWLREHGARLHAFGR